MFIKTKRKKGKSLLTLDTGTSTSLQKLRLFHLEKEKDPDESDCSQLGLTRLKKTVATWCSLCKQLLPHTQQPCARVGVRKAKCNGDTLHGEQSAQGQGKTWSGVAAAT